MLPLLWELPMATEGEYDGVSAEIGLSSSLESIPAEADHVLLYHLRDNCEVTGGPYNHTSLVGKAVMLDLKDKRVEPLAPDAVSRGVEISGAPSFLCVYRLASHKSKTLVRRACSGAACCRTGMVAAIVERLPFMVYALCGLPRNKWPRARHSLFKERAVHCSL